MSAPHRGMFAEREKIQMLVKDPLPLATLYRDDSSGILIGLEPWDARLRLVFVTDLTIKGEAVFELIVELKNRFTFYGLDLASPVCFRCKNICRCINCLMGYGWRNGLGICLVIGICRILRAYESSKMCRCHYRLLTKFCSKDAHPGKDGGRFRGPRPVYDWPGLPRSRLWLYNDKGDRNSVWFGLYIISLVLRDVCGDTRYRCWVGTPCLCDSKSGWFVGH